MSIPYENDMAVLEKINSKSKTEVELVDGHVNVNMNVNLNLILTQLSAAVVINPNAMEKMEQTYNQQMADKIAALIKKVQQEFKSDIFGIGEAMHTQHPDEWRSIKQNWEDDYFSSATVSVKVTSAINRAGTIENAFAYESE